MPKSLLCPRTHSDLVQLGQIRVRGYMNLGSPASGLQEGKSAEMIEEEGIGSQSTWGETWGSGALVLLHQKQRGGTQQKQPLRGRVCQGRA